MLEKVFWVAVGFVIARYLILKNPDYIEKEAKVIDDLRNKVHDVVKKYAPTADDTAVSNDVIAVIPDNK